MSVLITLRGEQYITSRSQNGSPRKKVKGETQVYNNMRAALRRHPNTTVIQFSSIAHVPVIYLEMTQHDCVLYVDNISK